MPQPHLPPQDNSLVKLLAMSPGPVPPGGDGALVEPEGGDDGLHRAAVAQQGDHDRHHIGRLLEAVVRGVAGGGEGPAAVGAAVTTLLSAMDADVAAPELPPCGAIGVVAELRLRVHRPSSWDKVWQPCPEGCLMDPHVSRG